MLFKSLVPMPQCYDIKATKDWYGSVLGFHCVGEMEHGWCRLEFAIKDLNGYLLSFGQVKG
jgi:hypothetical protein